MFKNVKWGNKELPGLSEEELLKLTTQKMAAAELGKIQGKKNAESGHLDNIRDIKACKRGGEKGGKISGPKNGLIRGKQAVESGQLKSIAPLGGKAAAAIINKRKKTCPYCNEEVNLGNYGRYHGDRCLLNKNRVPEKSDVIINGVTYRSIFDAMKKTELSYGTLKKLKKESS
jgi:hypothetical protein